MASPIRVNLSRRPFVNRRPVVRATVALWVLGGILVLVNAALIWTHRAGTVEGREELARVRAASVREVDRARALQQELAGIEVAAQNRHVDFLNQRIAQRSFPWSRLFEQLVEVLPRGVRLNSLFPSVEESGRRGRRRSSDAESRVRLSIQAQAESDDDMLEFVDRLYAHPAFEHPNLARESRTGSVVGFALDVLYLPGVETSPVPGESAVETSTGDAPTAAGAAETRASAALGVPAAGPRAAGGGGR